MLSATRKLLRLLNAHERKRLYLLFVAVLATAFAEIVGIASVMPFLSLVANPESVYDSAVLSWVYQLFGFQSENRFLFATGIGVLVILTVSNTLAAVTIWGLMRFAWMRNHALSRRLLGRYLARPYAFFLNRNTADLGKNILQEVGQLINGLLIPGLQAVARGMVALAIFGLLIVVDPLLALIIALVLGGAYAAIYVGVRRLLHRIGRDRFLANRERFQVANEAFGSVKLLKLMGREHVFLDRFTGPSKRFSNAMATSQVLGRVPRYGLELVAFGGVLVIVLYLLASGYGLGGVLPLAGLYAFAGYRLMPSLQQVFQGVTQVRFNAAVLDALYDELEGIADNPLPASQGSLVDPMPFRDRIELQNVTFRYEGADTPALSDVSLAVQAHTSVALVGPTGAGKTTLADIVLGLLVPESGRVTVDGVEITDENRANWQANLGYIPQDIYLQDATVARNIAFAVHPDQTDQAAVKRSARMANIHDFIVEELPHGYETEIGERGVRLSGGQRQRIGIARALYHDPEVLVMDEATSALDSATEGIVLGTIKSLAATKTLIIIAHRQSTIHNCDIVYQLARGQVLTPTQLELAGSSADRRKRSGDSKRAE